MKYLTGSELLNVLNTGNQMVSGMTAGEAATALGASQLANGMYVKSFVQTAENVVQFPGTAAAGAAAAAGTLTGGAASTTANLTVTASAGTTTLGGILSVAGPIAAVAATALAGFYIGTKINEANQEFFDDMIFPVLDKMFGNTTTVPVVVDSTGQTYIDKRIVDDVKNQLSVYQDTFAEVTERFTIDTVPTTATCKLSDVLPLLYEQFLNTTYAPRRLKENESSIRWKGYFKYIGNWLDVTFPGMRIKGPLQFLSTDTENRISFAAQQVRTINTIFLQDSTRGTYSGDFNGSSAQIINLYTDEQIEALGYSNDDIILTIDDVDVMSDGRKHFVYDNNVYNSSSAKVVYYDKYGVFHNENNTNTTEWSNIGGWYEIGPDLRETKDRVGYYSNFSYTGSSAQKALPEGVTYKKPVLDDTLPTISVYTGEVDGVPQEVPYVPVRIPATDPKIIEFPTPDDNPQHDNDNDPDKLTPFIPTEIPYPSNVPNIDPAPIPTPEENPDNLPTSLPSANPSNEPVVNPNPDIDPSTGIPTLPNVEVPDDPTENPIDNGEVITPSLPIPPIVPPEANGLFHVYNPTADQVNQFGAWLWTTFSGDLIDTLSKLFNNPMEAVIGLHELYTTPSTGSESTIKAGYLDSGVASRLVNKRYTSIDCGTLLVREYWGNYLDYSPYTKVQAYLPFIGIVDLHADDIIGRAINITYRIDAYTGACIAIITTATSTGFNAVTYQFSGNCAVEVPMTSGSMSSLQSALIGAVTAGIGFAVGGVGGAAAGGTAGVGAKAIAKGAKVIAGGAAVGGIHHKNDVAHSGTFGSAFGAMGLKKPYLIIKRPKQKVVRGYNKNYGYPAHKMVTVGLCSGYLKAIEVDVVSSTATEEEKKMIEELLKSGIFVS